MHPLDGAKVNSYKAIEENQLVLFLVIRLKIQQSCGLRGLPDWQTQLQNLPPVFSISGILNWSQSPWCIQGLDKQRHKHYETKTNMCLDSVEIFLVKHHIQMLPSLKGKVSI